ncbi:MAG: glycoside hydrolase family 28 protein [Bacteroides sp.]|nr:glycoside hydrolase family 28 protein [Bacteroides sp.]
MRKILSAVLVLACMVACITPATTPKDDIPSFSWVDSEIKPDLSWAKEVGATLFPGETPYKVNDYGAVGDGKTLNTQSIQNAIDSCSLKGDGTVAFNPGTYLIGALFLREEVNLHLGKDVILLASTDINDYPEFESRVAGIEMIWPAAVINVLEQKNVAVSGEELIDCQGKVFWDKYWEMRKEHEKEKLRWIVDYDCKRVRGILVSGSSQVTLKDFTIMRTGFWAVQVLYSTYCTVERVTINNNVGGHGPSTDGIDIDSSSYSLVENCDIDCNDDNICIKTGRDADGLRVNRPTEYVVIRNNVARKGAGLITCGSETSGSIRHILGYNLKAYGTSSALRLKSAMNRGGTVEHIYIYMDNVVVDSVRNVLAADLNWNPSYSYSELPEKFHGKEIPDHWKVMLTPVEPPERGYPRFRNVYMSNVRGKHAQQFVSASGWNDSLRLENFHLFNFEVEAQSAGKIVYTDNFHLRERRLRIADGSEIDLEHNTRLTADISYE